MAAISGVGTYILPHNFPHWIDLDDFSIESYVFDYVEVKFTTLKLLQSFFMPFLTANVEKKYT